MFGFALDTDNDPEIIFYIDEVDSLESRKSRYVYRKIKLINISDTTKAKQEIKQSIKNKENNGFIYSLDSNQKILHGTFIYNFRIVRCEENDLTINGVVWNESFGYQKALKMYINNEIVEKNLWKKFNKKELQGWLGFAFHIQTPEIDHPNVKIELDGNLFDNINEFYCAIGEAVNGPGGYFGRNFNALIDFFYGGFGVQSMAEVNWKNHDRSRKLLKRDFEIILEIFEERRVKVLLE
ncbi:barstar family protein [Chryseobacterium timonianum]|uniref:barstar family protein n=2 Tax=Chryseobacterium timonianum TaxID=1805473 RepID=UPI001F4BA09E|nr:barstar family protein [Chryseobacterium timonianum]